jgi:hypothetical protein
MRRLRLPTIVLTVALAFVAACGGDDGDDDPARFEGAASAAVAAFFAQEADGGRIPEGVNLVRVGIPSDRMFALEINEEQEQDGVTARYCMEYTYRSGEGNAPELKRVYLAQLIDGAWNVSVAKPSGTCEGVA